MRLWTIQPPEVYEEIRRTGVYRCDPENPGAECARDYAEYYPLITGRMKAAGMIPPEGIEFPVWAWYARGEGNVPPTPDDYRYMVMPGETGVLIEIKIDNSRVLLSDFETWQDILCGDEDSVKYLFNTFPQERCGFLYGKVIQGTFWELRKEDIVSAIEFVGEEYEEWEEDDEEV